MELIEGELLAGKYRIERVLGRGGMGVVVAATHLQLGERVALKFLLPEALGNLEAVERFAREARAAVRIKSEHVARVSDVGTLENGAPYMVMEYLEGTDLADWLLERGTLPVERAVEFVLQACEAIAEAHALGIVHRDLKPANLFVIERADGVLAVKVLDFGISKAMGLGSAGGLTTTSQIMGSPYYMSPEQMQSARDTDPRTDIWALGVVLHELLSGQYPFVAETVPELILKVVSAPPTPLRAAIAAAPARLESVILKCLEKDRNRRYPTVGALALDLLEFGPGRSRGSVERISGIMQRAGMSLSPLDPASALNGAKGNQNNSPDPTLASWGQSAPHAGKRRQRILWLAGCISVLGLGAIGYALSGYRSAPLVPAAAGTATSSDAAPVPQPTIAAGQAGVDEDTNARTADARLFSSASPVRSAEHKQPAAAASGPVAGNATSPARRKPSNTAAAARTHDDKAASPLKMKIE